MNFENYYPYPYLSDYFMRLLDPGGVSLTDTLDLQARHRAEWALGNCEGDAPRFRGVICACVLRLLPERAAGFSVASMTVLSLCSCYSHSWHLTRSCSPLAAHSMNFCSSSPNFCMIHENFCLSFLALT